jgi:hypothetical protein
VRNDARRTQLSASQSGSHDDSQECAKALVPDIHSIPTQANKAKQIMGVDFDLNNTVIKIGRVFNMRGNACSHFDILECPLNVISIWMLSCMHT